MNNLIAAIKFARSASGKKDVRYYLNGVNFDVRGGVLHVVGIDGHRMAVVRMTGIAWNADASVTLDHDTLDLLLLKHKKPAPMSLDVTEQALVIDGHPYPRLDGRFPDWRRVVPGERTEPCSGEVGINGAYLSDAGKASAALSTTRAPAVRFVMGATAKDAVTLHVCDLPGGLDSAYTVIMPTRV